MLWFFQRTESPNKNSNNKNSYYGYVDAKRVGRLRNIKPKDGPVTEHDVIQGRRVVKWVMTMTGLDLMGRRQVVSIDDMSDLRLGNATCTSRFHGLNRVMANPTATEDYSGLKPVFSEFFMDISFFSFYKAGEVLRWFIV